jgi:hypothetical protein
MAYCDPRAVYRIVFTCSKCIALAAAFKTEIASWAAATAGDVSSSATANA